MESMPQPTPKSAENSLISFEAQKSEHNAALNLNVEKKSHSEVDFGFNQQEPAKFLPPTELPMPVSSGSDDPKPLPVLPADDNLQVASNDDLIEKEWVTKAKKIVESTKEDPYMQGEEVSKLRIDYMKKRYGNNDLGN